MERVGERNKIFTEILAVTSAAGATSLPIFVGDCNQVNITCGFGTHGSATAITGAVTVNQAGNIAMTASTVVAGATATFGSATALTISNSKAVVITMGTAATLTDSLVINGVTLTYATVTNATNATALTFGSTEGSTVAAGIDNACNSLASVINAADVEGLRGLTASTNTTAAVRIVSNDTASTAVSVTSTADANFAVVSEKSQVMIDVLVSDLDSTSKYITVSLGTCNTAVNCSITTIKDGLRYKAPQQVGQYRKTT